MRGTIPGRYERRLERPLVRRLGAALAERDGSGEVSLSEDWPSASAGTRNVGCAENVEQIAMANIMKGGHW